MRGFEPHQLRLLAYTKFFYFLSLVFMVIKYRLINLYHTGNSQLVNLTIMGIRQAVRHRTLTPAYTSSNLVCPIKKVVETLDFILVESYNNQVFN